ncbi:hypothetical protein, partial [Streptomyces alkaliphilus]|uniref:hypothetical protein n=1 Tax=Streptomyces alkaliphilus TaxID=1472722 RepID=UPI00117E773E
MDPNHPAPRDEDPRETTGGPERVTEIVAGDFLVTVNPVDGSHIQSCPPSFRPPTRGRPGCLPSRDVDPGPPLRREMIR